MSPGETVPGPTAAGRVATRLGPVEAVIGLILVLTSVGGAWLTVIYPAALVTAWRGRSPTGRAIAAVLVLASAALAVPVAMGTTFLAAGTAAVVASVSLAKRPLDLSGVAGPALGAATIALAVGVAIAPGSLAIWEAALRAGVEAGSAQALERYRTLGIDSRTVEALEEMAAAMVSWTVRLWPAGAVLSAWWGAWLGIRLAGRWGRVDGGLHARVGNPAFERFRVADSLVWALLVSLLVLWVPHPAARRVAANGIVVMGLVYAIQGLAVGLWVLRRRGVGRLARTLIVTAGILLLPPFAGAILFAIGLADIWLAFRDRRPPEADGEIQHGGGGTWRETRK